MPSLSEELYDIMVEFTTDLVGYVCELLLIPTNS